MGGQNFETDQDFLTSAVADVDLLAHHGMRAASSLLDWGCGAGRLAVGIRERRATIREYHGVDVQLPLIRWARRHLGSDSFHFTHIDAGHARYNPGGAVRCSIPVADACCDVFYANSVFSHLAGVDVRGYLAEVRRLLRPDGFALFTAFVETDVEPEVENPIGYGDMEWSGALHCVRFERGHFEDMIRTVGLRVDGFEHGIRSNGQSMYVVRTD